MARRIGRWKWTLFLGGKQASLATPLYTEGVRLSCTRIRVSAPRDQLLSFADNRPIQPVNACDPLQGARL